jgi:putative protein kinase ArgK-like GTPase of G3E family
MRPKHSWCFIIMFPLCIHQFKDFSRWKPKVRTISSASGAGIEQLWADACTFRELGGAGIKELRGKQRGYWMWQEAYGILERSLKTSPLVQKRAQELQVGSLCWSLSSYICCVQLCILYKNSTLCQCKLLRFIYCLSLCCRCSLPPLW